MSNEPTRYELIDALHGMVCQYLENGDGTLRCDSVSASETAIDCLTRLGLIHDNKLIDESFDNRWMLAQYGDAMQDGTDY